MIRDFWFERVGGEGRMVAQVQERDHYPGGRPNPNPVLLYAVDGAGRVFFEGRRVYDWPCGVDVDCMAAAVRLIEKEGKKCTRK